MTRAFHGWRAAKWTLIAAAIAALFLIDGSPLPRHVAADGGHMVTYYLKGYARHIYKAGTLGGAKDSIAYAPFTSGSGSVPAPYFADTSFTTDSIPGNAAISNAFVTPFVPVFGARAVIWSCQANAGQGADSVSIVDVGLIDTLGLRNYGPTTNPAGDALLGIAVSGCCLSNTAGNGWGQGSNFIMRPAGGTQDGLGVPFIAANWARLRVGGRQLSTASPKITGARVKCTVIYDYPYGNQGSIGAP